MKLKERVENNPVVWLLSALFVGFTSGIATYQGILAIANLQVVSTEKYDSLVEKASEVPITEKTEDNTAVIERLNTLIDRAQTLAGDSRDPETNETTVVRETINWFNECKIALYGIGKKEGDTWEYENFFVNNIQLRDPVTTSFRDPETKADCTELLNASLGFLRGLKHDLANY